MPMDPDTGACIHLDVATKQCKIYDTRPTHCRVDESYENQSSDLTRVDYYKLNTKVCHTMIDELQLPAHYKVNLEEYDAS